jgi:hypothetical protein
MDNLKMGIYLFVVAYYKWTSDGITVRVKVVLLYKECAFAVLLYSLHHRKNVVKDFVKRNIPHQLCC